MTRKFFLTVLVLTSVFLFSSCKEDIVLPTFTNFTIQATVSGEREFQATITESYAEFMNEHLPFPVRYQDGKVLCEGTEVDVKAKEGSLFKISEIISELLSGNGVNREITRKSDRYELKAKVNGTEISVFIDKQTKTPTVFFIDSHTVTVTKFQDTTDESYTQNMGDG